MVLKRFYQPYSNYSRNILLHILSLAQGHLTKETKREQAEVQPPFCLPSMCPDMRLSGGRSTLL
jgi:hypothetical protein